jgi:hypothetical protein
MYIYLTLSLAVAGIAVYEIWSGKLMPLYYWGPATREERPLKYWFAVLLKIVMALVIVYLAAHHLLPDKD